MAAGEVQMEGMEVTGTGEMAAMVLAWISQIYPVVTSPSGTHEWHLHHKKRARRYIPTNPNFSPAPGIDSYFDFESGGHHYGGGGGGLLINGNGPGEYGYGAGGGGEGDEGDPRPQPQPGAVIFDLVG